MRIRLSLAAVAATFIALSAVDVQAFPAAPLNLADDAGQVIQVRGGCGIGRHRGPWGGCRWNRGYRAWGRAGCWWHRTPWGPRRICRW